MEINSKNWDLVLLKKYRNGTRTFGEFLCSCGNIINCRIENVKNGDRKSCGCKRKSKINKEIYEFWRGIKRRSTKNSIPICKDWLDYFVFEKWLIENKKEGWLNLVDDSIGFCPENCYFGNKIITKKQVKKSMETKIKKYGDPYYSDKNKLKNTCIERYGVDSPFKSSIIRDKSKKTNLEKYGVENPFSNKEIQEKIRNTNINNGRIKTINGKTISEIAIEKGYSYTGIFKAVKNNIDINLLKKNYSSIELKIQSILDKHNVSYEQQYRIDNRVADFKVGNLIIECDGLYWHSETNVEKEYHKEKRELYIKNGLTPLFFYEDEILNKENIVESIILNKIGKSNRIYARDCQIKELNTSDSNLFFEENHLMGKGSGKTVALFYQDKPVCCLRFKKIKGGFDISRFCPKLFTNVIGGYSRLIKFIEQFNPEFIQTFIDLRYGSGEYLEKFGFTKSTNYISFNWIKNSLRLHRLRFPGNSGYNSGFIKLHDCGQLKYIKLCGS